MDGPVNVDVVFAKKPPMLNCAIVLASLPSFGRPLYILDGHLKKTVFGAAVYYIDGYWTAY